MDEMKIDLGEVKSRDLGNVTKTLVSMGKEIVNDASAPEYIDYGSLPSRALTSLGKQALADKLDENNLQ